MKMIEGLWNFKKLYQKTCTRKENQEIKRSSDINGLRGINNIGGDEGDLY